MGRKKAQRRLTPDDFERETMGVECRTDAGVRDDAPLAYKDVDAVMAQADLGDIVHIVKLVCVKG